MKTTTKKTRKQKKFDGVVVFTVRTGSLLEPAATQLVESRKTSHDFSGWPENYDRIFLPTIHGEDHVEILSFNT